MTTDQTTPAPSDPVRTTPVPAPDAPTGTWADHAAIAIGLPTERSVIDRTTGRPATIYTPPEDCVPAPDAAPARVRRYRAALAAARMRGEASGDRTEVARAAIELADAEIADAVVAADVPSRTEAELPDECPTCGCPTRCSDAWCDTEKGMLRAEVERLKALLDSEPEPFSAVTARLAAVEALADEWERTTTRARPAFLVAADELRAALATLSVPGTPPSVDSGGVSGVAGPSGGSGAAEGAEQAGWAYVVPDSPKMLRETLCAAQAQVRNLVHSDRIGRLIAECDRHRPLGSDGKHGDLHTATCGCDR